MRLLQAMAFGFVLAAGCGGGDDDGEDDAPAPEGMTYGEIIEEYTMTICQRAVECACGEHDGFDDCRQDWMASYCGSEINCNSIANMTREEIDACKADSMVIPCDEPEMPASCDPLFPFGWDLSCRQTGR